MVESLLRLTEVHPCRVVHHRRAKVALHYGLLRVFLRQQRCYALRAKCLDLVFLRRGLASTVIALPTVSTPGPVTTAKW